MTENAAFDFAAWLKWWDEHDVQTYDINDKVALIVMFGQMRNYIEALDENTA